MPPLEKRGLQNTRALRCSGQSCAKSRLLHRLVFQVKLQLATSWTRVDFNRTDFIVARQWLLATELRDAQIECLVVSSQLQRRRLFSFPSLILCFCTLLDVQRQVKGFIARLLLMKKNMFTTALWM